MGPDATSGALAAAILQRLALAGAHAPARLTGARAAGLDAVWRSFAGPFETRRPLYINASVAAFDSFDVSDLIFGDDAAFSHAAFGSGTSFRQAMFGDRAVFDRATFADKVSFRGAEFGDEAKFSAACLGDHVDFDEAIFGDRAAFDDAAIGERASFTFAVFGECADFARASFADNADFGATFGNSAKFYAATFGDRVEFDATFGDKADFRCVRFGDGAFFQFAKFGAGATFSGPEPAVFGDDADFSYATFGDGANFGSAVFGNRAFFWGATFGERASFFCTTFGERALFCDATFGDKADFCDATFGNWANFSAATFSGGVSFLCTTFAGDFIGNEMACKEHFSMAAAEIRGYASFLDVCWPERFEHQHGAFLRCRFRDVANFATSDFSAFALFDGAEFEGRVLLRDPGDKAAEQLFLTAQSAAEAAVEADRQVPQVYASALRDYEEAMRQWEIFEANETELSIFELTALRPKRPTGAWCADEHGADARFRALSGGFHTLKLAMIAQGDTARAQRFHRYALKARVQQPSEPAAIKVVASVYGLAADYGLSIVRPIIALAVLLVSFATAYWLMGLSLGLVITPPAVGPIFQALELSLTSMFRPLSALTTDSSREAQLGSLLLGHSDFIALIVQFLSILQSVLALILAFLFGIALRRRFQIV